MTLNDYLAPEASIFECRPSSLLAASETATVPGLSEAEDFGQDIW